MSNAPAARSLGEVLADIKSHRATCAAEQVPTSAEKLLELHTEALEHSHSTINWLLNEVANLGARIDAVAAKPATKTTKAR